MKNEDITKIGDRIDRYHFALKNFYPEGKDTNHRLQSTVICATLIDYLRGDIEGLPSPLSDLARSTSDSSHPNPQNPPADNGDPNPIATEVMKKLGSLGLQSLSELKGYKYDADNHVLLHINGRLADSGWLMGDPHMCALADIMSSLGLDFAVLP